jgi:hypothetical protein
MRMFRKRQFESRIGAMADGTEASFVNRLLDVWVQQGGRNKRLSGVPQNIVAIGLNTHAKQE